MYGGNKHQVTIGGKTFIVDSNLEERVIVWLEANGFAGRWSRPEKGANVGKSNYTPDLLLSVQFEGMTHRAIVEIKPALRKMYDSRYGEDYIVKRMLGVAGHYYSQLILVYAEQEKNWYRIDLKTGKLTGFETLVPGKKPINKLYQGWSIGARSVRNHRYEKKVTPVRSILGGVASLAQDIITGPKKVRKTRASKKPKSWW